MLETLTVGRVTGWASSLGSATGGVQQSHRAIGSVQRPYKVTVETPWLCEARGYAQQMSSAAGLAFYLRMLYGVFCCYSAFLTRLPGLVELETMLHS